MLVRNFFTGKFQTETESTPLNGSVCAFSEFWTHPFSGRNLKYISLYMKLQKVKFTKWGQVESLWFLSYTYSIIKYFLIFNLTTITHTRLTGL